MAFATRGSVSTTQFLQIGELARCGRGVLHARMPAEILPELNWRDPAAYAPLLGADRSMIAWEWLRRDSDYRAAALGRASTAGFVGATAAHFGLVAFEPPHLSVPNARPLWSRSACPYVLVAGAGDAAMPSDWFDLEPIVELARVHVERETEHLLLSDGLRAIRLDGPRGCFTSGASALRYSLRGLVSADPPLLTLQRFLYLCRTGQFSRYLHRPEPRARRWVLILRTHDALAVGAHQRDIAEALLGRSLASKRWRVHDPSLRSQAQRLVRAAQGMETGYKRLLKPDRYFRTCLVHRDLLAARGAEPG